MMASRNVPLRGIADSTKRESAPPAATYNAFGRRVEDYQGTASTSMKLYYPRDIFGQRTGIWDDHSSVGWVGWDVYWSQVAGQRLNMGGSSAYIDHSDAVGSTTMETDPAGSVQWDIVHYPWGQIWQQGGTRQTGVYAGLDWQVNDPLLPSATRELSPALGRWMSPDPLGGDVTNPQSLNRYAYVTNNPATFTDPLGLDPRACQDPAYADSHAECRDPGSSWCSEFPYDPSCSSWGYPSGSGGNGSGRGGGGGTVSSAPPAGQPPLAGGVSPNPWVSNTITAPGADCYGHPGIIPGLPSSSGEPCFLIFATSSATLGGYLSTSPGPGARIGNGGVVPTHNYWEYLGCVYDQLIAKQIETPEEGGLTVLLNAAPFAKRTLLKASPEFYLIVAGIWDLGLELKARAVCSQQVYGGAQ